MRRGWGLLALLLVAASCDRTTPAAPSEDAWRPRACALDPVLFERIDRGFDPERSEDVIAVPREPNYIGTFSVRSHSGPWDYLQRVPFLLYGAGIEPGVVSEREVTLADVYPTVERLLGVDLEPRDGRVLHEALGGREHPRLLVTVMWDGVGRNVMDEWPDAWPNLARLARAGAWYENATVGSSPSITPSTHSNLGTGTFPKRHGSTGLELRVDGEVQTAFAQRSPEQLKLSTFADQIDVALGNRPKAGMLAWRLWHLGMLGHGSYSPGGDKDQLGLIGFGARISGNRAYFDTPAYLNGFPGLDERMQAWDLQDGTADGRWMGHELDAQHDSPAWVEYQQDVAEAMLAREGYGADDTIDLFFANYKPTDLVGHYYGLESPEMEAVLRAQDAALGRLVAFLDEHVGDYTLFLSADHGSTPSPPASGGWPIDPDELHRDLARVFSLPEGENLVERNSPAGLFLDRELLARYDVTPGEVASFMAGYTIADSWPEDELPEGYEDRGGELVYDAVWPNEAFEEVRACVARA